MTTEKITQDLLQVERQFWQAMLDKDAGAAARMSDDACIVAGASGVARISKQEMAGMLQGAQWELKQFEFKDPLVQVLANDLALLAYKVHEVISVDGQDIALDAADTSVWQRQDGQWTCVLHTESLLGDPFGRDRR